MYNFDMFDVNGTDKLCSERVADREQIIRFHSKNPNALFFCSHSAGKDSQAMYLRISKIVPKERIIVVHANLGKVEHEGVIEHIQNTTNNELFIVKNESMDFIDMTLMRGKFPSPKQRSCTSSLKTSQIDKLIRRVMDERGATVGFNCIGLRAQESRARSMKNPLFRNERLSATKRKNRLVFDWLPVFHLSEKEVYDSIYGAGQKPHHAYGFRGSKNQRLSCILCIMGCTNDLKNGARDYPGLYAETIAIEKVIDHTMFTKVVKKVTQPIPLDVKIGIEPNNEIVESKIIELKIKRKLLLEAKAIKDKEKSDKAAARKAGKIPKTRSNSKKVCAQTNDMFAA